MTNRKNNVILQKMNQLPSHLWQQIANEAALKLPESKIVFGAGIEGIEAFEKAVASAPLEVAARAALETVWPVWAENQAIQAWLNQSPQRDGLRQVLPELDSIQSAVALMQQEYRLSPAQTRQLEAFLQSGQMETLWKKSAMSLSNRG